MTSAPVPADEKSRLAVLQALGVLDTPREDFSQALALAAAAIADAPIAAITLVDGERQWFKGSHGLDVRETPRAVAFCAYTVLGDAPMVIEDARHDERFADNPLVVGEPRIRFYVGFPLMVSSYRVGALCVIDNRPRSLSAEQMQRLEDLARGTSAWLEAFRGKR